ncbi:MAG TPA: alanine racemase, partial [Saprospiraceae bacterium]|nr:alanine racemase [Saprospiraceae bacterium]
MSHDLNYQISNIKNNLIRPTYAEIDLAAARHNIKRIREIVGPQVKVLSMVKAEAYGHGLRAIAQTAIEAGASALGFATLSEALTLKDASLKIPLMVFG